MRPRHPTPRSVQLSVVAVAAFSLFAGPGAIAHAAPAPDIAAVHLLRMQQQAPLVDAAAVIRAAVEESGAGGLASIAIEEKSVAVRWKGGVLPAAVAATVERVAKTTPVHVLDAAYSMAELRTASAELEKQLHGDARFHGIKARPDGSGLIVLFDGFGPAATSQARINANVPATISVEERLQPVSRLNDTSPWSGGARIVNTTIGAGCTAGFGVNTPAGPAVLTAGHCGETGNRITDGGGEFIGNIGADDNTFDVLIIPTNAVSNRIYVGGADSAQQRTVTASATPFIGERLCQSGNTSANSVGSPICNLEVLFEWTDSQRLWEARQLDGQTAARPGDSGGPVYLDRGDGTVHARGTTTRVAGSRMGFAGFEKAQQRFGATIPGGGGSRTGQIVGAQSGKCLDINASGTADGTKVQLWTCNGTNAQRWTIGADGTVRGLGKCLDVRASGTANGTIVQLWTCNGTAAQTWSGQANGSLVNPQSGKCLDVTGQGTANGTQVIIWACSGGANQRWALPA